MLIAGTPEFMLFCLILARMSGFIFFNPVLGRRSIPGMYRAGMAMVLTLIIYTVEAAAGEIPDAIGPLEFSLLLLKELAVGYVLGFVLQLFDFVMTFAGAVIDFQMGLSMSTVYDPQNGVQVALTGQILEIYFMLLFFAVDGHLAMIRILLTSAEAVPFGAVVIGQFQANAIVTLFTECVVLAMKLAIPIIAIEFLAEIAMGLLCRIIPQINLFVLNIEMKVVLGVLALMFLISPIGESIGDIITQMLGEMQGALRLMAG